MAPDMPINPAGDKPAATASDGAAESDLTSLAKRVDEARHARSNADAGPQQNPGEAVSLGMKLASELLAALIVGGVLGFAIDTFFDTKPLFILMGLALGCGAAFLNVLRLMKKLSAEQASTETTTD